MRARVERMLEPLWVRALLLGLLAVVLSVVLWWPALSTYPLTQNEDGGFYHRMIEAAKVSIFRYHELPLWNAFECGGVPLWDNPQSPVGAPLTLLTLGINTTAAIRLWYVVHSAAGFVCMWLFARHELRLSRAAALAAGIVFALTAAPANHFGGGHFTFVPFLYSPLALLLWRRAENDRRFAVGTGMLFALMFMEGAVYPVPEIGLLLAAETVTRMQSLARVKKILLAAAIFGCVFVALSAARLFPVIDQLRHHTRPLGTETDAISVKTLIDMYTARGHELRVAGQTYVWGEYIAYLGPLALLFAFLGLLSTKREELWFMALAFFVFALMLGHFHQLAPWHILKGYIPPYKEMRVPSRFRLILLVFLAGWIGMAMDRLPTLVRSVLGRRMGNGSRTVLAGLALVGAGDALGYASTVVAPRFTTPAEQRVVPSTRLFFGGNDIAAFIDQPRQNRGRLECWEEWIFTAGAPQWLGDVPQAKSRDANVVVEVANRTQNRFTIDVDAKAPGRVLVNLPYDRGWRTDVGTVADENKLLVVDIPAGRHRIHLRYWPHGLTEGFVATGLGILGVVVFFVRERRRRRKA